MYFVIFVALNILPRADGAILENRSLTDISTATADIGC